MSLRYRLEVLLFHQNRFDIGFASLGRDYKPAFYPYLLTLEEKGEDLIRKSRNLCAWCVPKNLLVG